MNMMRRDLPTPPRPTVAQIAKTQAQGSNPAARPAPGVPGVRPTVKADELFQVIKQLCDLLVKENTALKRHKPDEVKALTERKEQLARLYQSHMNAVHRDPGLLKALEPAKRDQLTQTAVRLGDLMQENASLLKANIQSINMFFKAVNDALKTRQEEKAAAYSRNGALNGYAVTKRSLAVSFNQTM
jgi:flagellar biosynthesis/type III secretory pathway chaperone